MVFTSERASKGGSNHFRVVSQAYFRNRLVKGNLTVTDKLKLPNHVSLNATSGLFLDFGAFVQW